MQILFLSVSRDISRLAGVCFFSRVKGLWEDGVMVKFGSLFVVIEMHEEDA
jgi:hypothetical protein